MVDFASYFQYGSNDGCNGELVPTGASLNCTCAVCRSNTALAQRYRVRFDETAGAPEWEEEQYVVCPPRVLGYILRKKQWAQLQVDKLRPIKQGGKEDAWTSRLKLANEDIKTMLLDLVRSHSSGSKDDKADKRRLSVDDIVPGKGKGLVILLYGKLMEIARRASNREFTKRYYRATGCWENHHGRNHSCSC